MRITAAAIMILAAVSACAQKNDDPAQSAVALRDQLIPCVQQGSQSIFLSEAALAGARDPHYAEQARQSAITCRQIRENLERTNPESACISVARAFEIFGWELNATFEGRKEFSEISSSLSNIETTMPACLEELPPPTETLEQQAANNKIKEEAQAAQAETERASKRTEEAASAAAQAQADLTNTMRKR